VPAQQNALCKVMLGESWLSPNKIINLCVAQEVRVISYPLRSLLFPGGSVKKLYSL